MEVVKHFVKNISIKRNVLALDNGHEFSTLKIEIKGQDGKVDKITLFADQGGLINVYDEGIEDDRQ